MGKLLFFFIDGVGLGEDDENVNPLLSFLSPFLGTTRFCEACMPVRGENYVLRSIDADLGVDGLPQSATGQTAIMTGINAAEHLGFHMQAFPNEKLIRLLREHNLFIDLSEAGIPSTCANLYSREFLEERRNKRKNMMPVSALSLEAAGIPYRFIQDYRNGRALFADITNRFLRDRGFDIPVIPPGEGAERILNLFDSYRFVFFEYFLTDRYGHSRDYEHLKEEVDILNAFLSELKKAVDDPDDPVDILIASDHGNAEDIRTGDHTHNPAPFFFASQNTSLLDRFAGEVHDLTDIKQAVLTYFGIPPAQERSKSLRTSHRET